MLALKEKCLHPETKQPYIKRLEGGINSSSEGLTVSSPLYFHEGTGDMIKEEKNDALWLPLVAVAVFISIVLVLDQLF